MKKVLLITLRSDHGGGPKHVLDIASRLPTKSLFIASPVSAPYGEKFRSRSSEHFSLPHRKFSILSFIRLLYFVRSNNIDIVHSHGRGAGLYSRLLSLFSVECIHTYHGIHIKDGIFSKISNFIDKSLTKLTHKLIFVSDSEKSNAQKIGLAPENISFVVENGVSLPQLENEESNCERKVLGTLTRLEEHKNNEYLIRRIHENNQYHLKVAGDGPQHRKLLALVEELGIESNVEFLGNVEDPYLFLKDIDIYVSSSKGEGMPYAVLEAMACKKPCLLSRVSGHVDLVDSEQLFESNEEFNSKLENIKINYSKIQNLNREKVENHFNIEKQIAKIIHLYQ
ncbi:glycosyltransferase family 4 protein [Halobacteriovorax sp. HLS]|uniref:glycosyltransferase family 4 protein n=1 Tax=Halobacteriovorax sp. HLS TaxID=2234000 RepID=UPI000FD848F2|nr:glycosyltransferase family 4 protein [Halobacteriovorax sp. HLS]